MLCPAQGGREGGPPPPSCGLHHSSAFLQPFFIGDKSTRVTSYYNPALFPACRQGRRVTKPAHAIAAVAISAPTRAARCAAIQGASISGCFSLPSCKLSQQSRAVPKHLVLSGLRAVQLQFQHPFVWLLSLVRCSSKKTKWASLILLRCLLLCCPPRTPHAGQTPRAISGAPHLKDETHPRL